MAPTTIDQATPQWIEFDPRYARLLLLLQQQRQRDQQLQMPDEQIGWKTRQQLADEVSELTGYRLEPASVGTYLSEINRKVHRQLGDGVDLIQYRRNLGMRLSREVRVVDRRAADADADRGDADWRLYFPAGTERAAFLSVRRTAPKPR